MQSYLALAPSRRKSVLTALASLAQLALAAAANAGQWPLSDWSLGLLTGVGAGGLFAAALLWFMPDTSDAVPSALSRRYVREFTPAMIAYVAVMLVWKRLLEAVEMPMLRLLIALVPAVLLVWIMRAVVRYVRDCDEMQRRIEVESGAVAALMVCTGYMTLGFLQTAELIDIPSKIAMLWVFPALCFSYGLAKVVIARRYG